MSSRYLCSAFHELCRCRYNERGQPPRSASTPDLEKITGNGGAVSEELKTTIVCDKENGIESAIAEDWCRCAYALTKVPAWSKCVRKLCDCGTGVAVIDVGEGALPAWMRVLMRSSGLPMRMPVAPLM